jgi:hypothetical protein
MQINQKKTYCLTKYDFSLIYLNKNLAPSTNYECDGELVQSETSLQNCRNYFLKLYLLPECEQTPRNVFGKIHGIGYSIIKKLYFDNFRGLNQNVSPTGLKIHTFEIHMNVQLMSPCRITRKFCQNWFLVFSYFSFDFPNSNKKV